MTTIRQEKPLLAGKAVWSHLEEGMIDDLITTLELVRDAVWSKDKDKGFEAVTIFLLQFMDVFGHSHSFTSKMFPILEELKDRIQAGDFDEANSSVLALLVRMRQVKEALSASKE